jgi:RND family efflux transporter MFP subunit
MENHVTSNRAIIPCGWRLPGAALLSASLLAGCGGGAGGAAGPPAMAVEAVTLKEHPVEQTTEYVGTIKSRRSTSVQPQVEGFITQILVRSGDRVQPGSTLMQIDPSTQQAAVSNLESVQAAREADLRYAQQEGARLQKLFDAGASSRSELEQAQTALQTAEAQRKAVEAQIRQQKVTLAYYAVTASTAGIVGDVPVRVGDSVTRSTVLTTIDQSAGLEVYINVPVQQAGDLRVGLPVHLVDDAGRVVSTEEISFVAPSVDPGTQSVLAKASLARAGGLRTEQFVRCRIVWSKKPALTIPLVAVNRVNGQFFAYVAETGEGGLMVARQRAIATGPVVGNDYVVESGLKAGESLIVSGVQKIGDGAPVKVSPAGSSEAAAAAGPAAPGGKGE